MGDDAEWDI